LVDSEANRVERRPIFRTDRDREDFLRRVAAVVEEEDLRLFAFVLMDNHFRLVVLEGHVRPVEASRYLNIRTASITGHLRALRRAD
jgi:REP element-mobilizing transposase RayT